MTKVIGYRKVEDKTGRVLDVVDFTMPETMFDTDAMYVLLSLLSPLSFPPLRTSLSLSRVQSGWVGRTLYFCFLLAAKLYMEVIRAASLACTRLLSHSIPTLSLVLPLVCAVS